MVEAMRATTIGTLVSSAEEAVVIVAALQALC